MESKPSAPVSATEKRHLPLFLQKVLKRHSAKLRKAEQLLSNLDEPSRKTVLWRNCESKYKQRTAANQTSKVQQARRLLFYNSIEYTTMRKTQPGTDNSI